MAGFRSSIGRRGFTAGALAFGTGIAPALAQGRRDIRVGLFGSTPQVLSGNGSFDMQGSGTVALPSTLAIASSAFNNAGTLLRSTGIGTPGHLNGELFRSVVGIEATHVPYRVGTQGVTDLLSAADTALYKAKQAGRNQVMTAPLRPYRLDRPADEQSTDHEGFPRVAAE